MNEVYASDYDGWRCTKCGAEVGEAEVAAPSSPIALEPNTQMGFGCECWGIAFYDDPPDFWTEEEEDAKE